MATDYLSDLFHQHYRRQQNIPTLSIMVGKTGISYSHWKQFAEKIENHPIRLDHFNWETIINKWLQQFPNSSTLYDASLRYLAQKSERTVEEIRNQIQGKSIQEKEIVIQSIFNGDENTPAELVSRFYLLNNPELKTPDFDVLTLKQLFGNRHDSWETILSVIYHLEPSWTPAIFFAIKEKNNSTIYFMEIANNLLKILDLIPSLSIALAVRKEDYHKTIAEMPESRTKALCQESVIYVQPLSDVQIKDRLKEKGMVVTPDVEARLNNLANIGVSEDAVDRYVEAAQSYSKKTSKSFQSGEARSHAEAFLFACLETMEESTGRFVLNQPLNLTSNSNEKLEIDLLSPSDKIAIEIDGYYHFQDIEQYRRDRQKDFLLQKHGYFVLRFHAEDVMTRLESILSTIRETIRSRQQTQEME